MTGEGRGLGMHQEVRAANIDGNAVGMKAGDCDCIFMQMCSGPRMCAWLVMRGPISRALDCSRSSPQ